MFKVVASLRSVDQSGLVPEGGRPPLNLGVLNWLRDVDEEGHLTLQNPVTLDPISASTRLVFHALCGNPLSMNDLQSIIGDDSDKATHTNCTCCQNKIDFLNPESAYGLISHQMLFERQPLAIQQELKTMPQWTALEAISLTFADYQDVLNNPVFVRLAEQLADVSEAQARMPRFDVPCLTFQNRKNPELSISVVKVTEDMLRGMETSEGFLPDTPLLEFPRQAVPFPTNEQFAAMVTTLRSNTFFDDAPSFAYLHSTGRLHLIHIDQLPVRNMNQGVKLKLTNTIDTPEVRDSRDFYLNNEFRFEENVLVIQIAPHRPPLRIQLSERPPESTPLLLATLLERLPETYCIVSIEQHPQREGTDQPSAVQLSRQNRTITYFQICERARVYAQSGIPLHTIEDAHAEPTPDGPATIRRARGPLERTRQQFQAIWDSAVHVGRNTSTNLAYHLAVISVLAVAVSAPSEHEQERHHGDSRMGVNFIERCLLVSGNFLALDVTVQFIYRFGVHAANHIRRSARELANAIPVGTEQQLRYLHGGVSGVSRDEEGTPRLRLLSNSDLK